MSAIAIGFVGICLIILGTFVWIFRPNQAGDNEFEFLGFRAKVNAPAIAVMAFGIAMILASYTKETDKPGPEPDPKYALCNIARISGSARTSDQDKSVFELDIANNRIDRWTTTNGDVVVTDSTLDFACTGTHIFFYIDAAFNPKHAGPDPMRRTAFFEGDIHDDHSTVSGTMSVQQYAKSEADTWSWQATITRK
jgi:hypothetical protein